MGVTLQRYTCLHILQYDQPLYTVGQTALNSHLDIAKNDNGRFQKWKVDKSILDIQQDKG